MGSNWHYVFRDVIWWQQLKYDQAIGRGMIYHLSRQNASSPRPVVIKGHKIKTLLTMATIIERHLFQMTDDTAGNIGTFLWWSKSGVVMAFLWVCQTSDICWEKGGEQLWLAEIHLRYQQQKIAPCIIWRPAYPASSGLGGMVGVWQKRSEHFYPDKQNERTS